MNERTKRHLDELKNNNITTAASYLAAEFEPDHSLERIIDSFNNKIDSHIKKGLLPKTTYSVVRSPEYPQEISVDVTINQEYFDFCSVAKNIADDYPEDAAFWLLEESIGEEYERNGVEWEDGYSRTTRRF